MSSLLLRAVCIAESATGLALLVFPSAVAKVLLGSDLMGSGMVLARIGGIALIGLGVACWPSGRSRGLQGMLVYSAVAAGYMALVGLGSAQVGMVWWPAVAIHAAVAILLGRALFQARY